LVPVDGVAEDPDQFLFDFDKVMEANLAEVIGTQDTVLLGRKIYDEWSNYRPKSDDQPFADFINSVHKHVATATPTNNPAPGSSNGVEKDARLAEEFPPASRS